MLPITFPNRLFWFWLIPALLVAATLGARELADYPLWIDELYSVGNIGAVYRVPFNPAQVWESVQVNSPQHTPGYFFALSGWAALVGWSPLALRALSLGFGLLATAWTYRAGRDWFSPRAGLYAAAILCVSAFFIHFTHEIRMYTLVALLTIFTIWVYRRILFRPTAWLWPALFLGALSLIYTHVIGFVPLGAIGLYHLLFAPKNRRWLAISATLAAAGLLFLPWLNVILGGARYGSREDIALGPVGVLRALWYWFSNGQKVLLLGLVVLTAVVLYARRQKQARVIVFLLIAMLLLTIILNEVTDIITPNRTRYLMPLWPLFALLLGLGLATLAERRRFLALALLAVWSFFGLYNNLNPDFLLPMDGPRHVVEFPPLEEIVEEVNEVAEPEHFLVTFAQHQHVFERFKFVSIGEFHFHDLEVDSYRVTLPDPRPLEDIRQEMKAAVGTHLSVWFAYEPEIEPEMLQPYREILSERYQLCATAFDQPELRIERYDYAAFGCLDEPEGEPLLTYTEGIQLADLRLENAGDGFVRLAAGWDVSEQVPANTYSVSLKIWPGDNPADSFMAQADYGLRSAGFGWQMAELPVHDLPPGDYRVTLTVYDWRLGPRLLAAAQDGAQGEELTVAHFSLPAGGEDA